VAALFAVHPLRVESVAWLAERKDVLSGLLWMLCLLVYASYGRNPKWTRYVLLVVTFALGLMAKPMLVTLPLVLLLLDFWPLGRWRPGAEGWKRLGGLFLEKAPLLLLSAASSAITLYAQRVGGALGDLERLPLAARLSNAAVAYVLYLWKSVWPTGLACFYPHSMRATWISILAVSLLIGVTVLVWLQRRPRPHLLVGWLWYVGAMIPVIGIFQVGMQSMADRYAYLPLIGIYLMVVWSLAELARRRPFLGKPLVIGAALVVAALSVAAWFQVRVWKESVTLFERAVAVTEDNYIMHNNLGRAYALRGDYERAVQQYETTLRIKPDFAKAHHNLGNAHLRRGEYQRAAERYREAIRLVPDYALAHHNLGGALVKLGDLDRALFHFREAVRSDPGYARAHRSLAMLYASRGRLAEARASAEEAQRLDPGDAVARRLLEQLRSVPSSGPERR
jgi:tetratricopeptide (TPR) repeat protein